MGILFVGGMDRTWMSANRMSKEYQDGVKEFVRVAVAHAKNKSKDTSKIICPCLIFMLLYLGGNIINI
jgi:hypothetical protein